MLVMGVAHVECWFLRNCNVALLKLGNAPVTILVGLNIKSYLFTYKRFDSGPGLIPDGL